MKLHQSVIQRVARAGVAAVAFAMLAACASAPGASGASAALPADSTVATGRIVGKQYLTTVTTTGAAPSAGPSVGVGGIGGNGWSGAGAGVGFDITSLFQKKPEQTSKVYRYSVQMQDGSKRDIDSTLDLTDGACVTTIDSSAPGYPRLALAESC